jgi:hypothetical protein
VHPSSAAAAGRRRRAREYERFVDDLKIVAQLLKKSFQRRELVARHSSCPAMCRASTSFLCKQDVDGWDICAKTRFAL